ncbi:hypothetical protein H103_05239 [Trichophyton rubrum CBS 288.86]|uniref:Uncharacterized protein n=1 Tax=Trichophyton rubrum CBS 288.86 TaxID=1215330 RepID=A0A022VZ72_TRIRU|nr:hypothetical protein H103_05239 [Trichophyton rubrum CBS 288.86]KMQ45772.1 hypothetical protein HL42_3557 [Trichophyton rubrum]
MAVSSSAIQLAKGQRLKPAVAVPAARDNQLKSRKKQERKEKEKKRKHKGHYEEETAIAPSGEKQAWLVELDTMPLKKVVASRRRRGTISSWAEKQRAQVERRENPFLYNLILTDARSSPVDQHHSRLLEAYLYFAFQSIRE